VSAFVGFMVVDSATSVAPACRVPPPAQVELFELTWLSGRWQKTI
jgi:hypothetical protein